MTIMCGLRNRLRTVAVLVGVGWLGMGVGAAASPSGSSTTLSAKSLLTLAREVGRFRERQTPSADEARALGARLAQAAEQVDESIRDTLLVYQAEVLAAAGERAAVGRILAEIKSAPEKPEVLLARMRLIEVEELRDEDRSDATRKKIAIGDTLGGLFPMSNWGAGRDVRLNTITIKPRLVPQYGPVPNLAERAALDDVAKSFESIGKREDAINAYLMAIYSRLENRSSVAIGQDWLKVAALERDRGHASLAWRAYLHAAVASDETMQIGINELSRHDGRVSSRPAGPASAPGRNEKDVLQDIMSLYRRMNLHPLAMRLAAESARDGMDLSSAVQDISEEWRDIVHSLIVERWQFYVFGLKITDVGDWAKADIALPTATFWLEVPGEEGTR